MPKKPELSAADQALRESIGIAIRLASASSGRKPADVACAGGVSLAHEYRIESGERTADSLYLVKVARYLNMTVDELINPPSGATAANSPKRSTKAPPDGVHQVIAAPVFGSVAGGNITNSHNNKK